MFIISSISCFDVLSFGFFRYENKYVSYIVPMIQIGRLSKYKAANFALKKRIKNITESIRLELQNLEIHMEFNNNVSKGIIL